MCFVSRWGAMCTYKPLGLHWWASPWDTERRRECPQHPRVWYQPRCRWKFYAGRNPDRRNRKGVDTKKVVFFCGCVLFAPMRTFVSECSRNICLSSEGLNAFLSWEEGGGEGAQWVDSCTSGLLCNWYSRGKRWLAAGMVSCGKTSCDLPLVL